VWRSTVSPNIAIRLLNNGNKECARSGNTLCFLLYRVLRLRLLAEKNIWNAIVVFLYKPFINFAVKTDIILKNKINTLL
jgi:hypothetical protein